MTCATLSYESLRDARLDRTRINPHITDGNIYKLNAWLHLNSMLRIFFAFVIIICSRLPPIALEKPMLIIGCFVRIDPYSPSLFSCLNQDDIDNELNEYPVVIGWVLCLNAVSSPSDAKRLLNIMPTDLPKCNTIKYGLSLFQIRLW